MIRSLLIILCALSMIFTMASCQNGKKDQPPVTTPDIATETDTEPSGDEPDPPVTGDPTPSTFALNSDTKGIKILGERCLYSATQLNCDWTGSGLEMDVMHEGGDMVFTAAATGDCYFRTYVDGVVWKDAEGSVYHTVTAASKQIIMKNVPVGRHRIKIIKVTGYTLARAQIFNVKFAGSIIETPPEDKDLYIEFVGDSICCGWGTIGEHQGAYTDQDGTLAYPLKVAERLNADYSVTALSGQGLLMGNPGMTNGYLYASALRSTEQEYAFERKADIVVINIGTNDYSRQTQYSIDAEKFKTAYVNFLKTVMEKNGPDCKIYCLYNTMNDTFYNAILSACQEVCGGSNEIYTLKMERTASGHPTVQEHEKYTAVLVEALKNNTGVETPVKPPEVIVEITVNDYGELPEYDFESGQSLVKVTVNDYGELPEYDFDSNQVLIRFTVNDYGELPEYDFEGKRS